MVIDGIDEYLVKHDCRCVTDLVGSLSVTEE